MKTKLQTYSGVIFFLNLLLLASCSDDVKKYGKKKLKSQEEYTGQYKKPSWLDDIPLVVAGGWDSEPSTQRRWGTLTVDYMDEYNRRMTEETVIKLKE